MSVDSYNRLRLGEVIMKTTAIAAIGLSALFGAHKFHEGMNEAKAPAVEYVDTGHSSDDIDHVWNGNVHNAMEATADLTLGVAGLSVASLLVLGTAVYNRSHRRRSVSDISILEQDDNDYSYAAYEYTDTYTPVNGIGYAAQRPSVASTPNDNRTNAPAIVAAPAVGFNMPETNSYTPLDPAALGWDDRRPAMA